MTKVQDHFDVIVVGGGIQGLCAAHTFLSINPSLSLLIIDSKGSVGGAWSKEQVWTGLYANNLQGFLEFTDFPMLDADVGVTPQGRISGEAFSAYLQKYAEHFDLLRRIRFHATVLRATNSNDTTKAWTLEVAGVLDQVANYTVSCCKLLVATGQTSHPLYPSYPGTSTFRKPLIHTVDIASAGTKLLHDPSAAHVTILGGGKSAHDAVYRYATAGKRVTWIIRRTGRGGHYLSRPYPRLGPFSLWLEGLLMTRPLSWFGACPWSAGDGFGAVRYLLHNTAGGRFLVRNYFANMSQTTLTQSGILRHEETKVLVPKETLMWYGGQGSILNYDTDFYALLHDANVEIIRADVSSLDNDALVLDDGTRVQTDAVVCATGYAFGPAFPIVPTTQQPSWGVPLPTSSKSPDPLAALDAKADAELLARFPELANSPSSSYRETGEPRLSPWRLWRFIAPPAQVAAGPRTLAFLTTVESYQNMLKAELVALWTYAYLHDELSVSPAPGDEAAVLYEAALWSRFGRWRCAMGARGKTADFLHDALPFYDLLLRDLGLKCWRKGCGLLGEVFGGWYELKEYRGVVQEWVAGRARGRGKGKGPVPVKKVV